LDPGQKTTWLLAARVLPWWHAGPDKQAKRSHHQRVKKYLYQNRAKAYSQREAKVDAKHYPREKA